MEGREIDDEYTESFLPIEPGVHDSDDQLADQSDPEWWLSH